MQSLIGIPQWTITLGRFDVGTAVMTMSGFRITPRVGHLARLRRICGHPVRFSDGCIRVRMEKPDYSALPDYDQSWLRSVCGDAKESLPDTCPMPRGKSVCTTTCKDANLCHNMATGRVVTRILHFINKTPIDWHSKKQSTVETATHGSEFTSAKTAIQQTQGLRTTLRCLGVPLDNTSHMFGDNGSAVTSSAIPDSQLGRRHLALSCHYMREAVASGMVKFHHIPGEINPADLLSKHWSHAELHPRTRTLFFWQGDTKDLFDKETASEEKGEH
jgi:hypothetical protein